ncbi:hypothetical protein QQS21_003270 [Conoideocrella luteorostrata]|uniref:Uncharacterized protein n=1 Tax=Conoideocrella luteorostrata TaxID=1105319 RepID=A0AAJ0CW63_9HYPO|nr:hypothetical protein QQS21_003270 [Conoideocrella luteorostrata]
MSSPIPSVDHHPSYNTIVCNGSILPTPTYGLRGAVFTVCGESSIRGSVAQVSNAILDFRKYYEWNTFITNASVPDDVCTPDCVYAPGLRINFTSTGIVPGLTSVGHDVTSYIERPYFFAWTNTESPAQTGISEHVSIFVPLSGGKVRYTHWQTQYGTGAKNLLPVKGNFQSQFQKQADELKVYVEETMS